MNFWRLTRPKSAGWASRLESQGQSMVHYKPKILLAESPLALERGQSFVPLRPSTDGMRPTHIMESNLLYSKSTNWNINLLQNTLMETSRIMCGYLSGHCSPVGLPDIMNHHISYQWPTGSSLLVLSHGCTIESPGRLRKPLTTGVSIPQSWIRSMSWTWGFLQDLG